MFFCSRYTFGFGPGFGTVLLFCIIIITNVIVYIKIEAYQAPISAGNDLLVEVKLTERLLFIINNIYSLISCLACFLFYTYDSIILLSFSACFLYIYVGIIMPSVAILKNPSMKAFISGRFLESVIVVVDWNKRHKLT